MSASNSASAKGQAIRKHARRGVWRPILSAMGVTAHTRTADAQADAWDAGGEGERRTRVLLDRLPPGWWVGHDRRIPQLERANADHLVVSPGGRLFLIDSKMRHARGGATVHARDGRLWHGQTSMDRDLRSLNVEAHCVADAVGVQVWRLICVHVAPVAGGGFEVQGVGVLPAGQLLPLLVAEAGIPNPRTAATLAHRVDATFPTYCKTR